MGQVLNKKLIFPFSLLALVVLLTACPYSSSVPIDEGTVKVPVELAGKWIAAEENESENPTYFVITIDDSFHATSKKMEYSAADSSYTPTIYHLTFSDVDGETFMNAKEAGINTYNLYKFNFNVKTGEISTSEITDYIKEVFNTSKELKEFISKNKSNSYFYTNTTDNYVRKL
jgi:hypothetical protein